jgi:hypothetical protein
LRVRESAKVRVEANGCAGNGDGGIAADHGSFAALVGNVRSANGAFGIPFAGDSRGSAEGNTGAGNANGPLRAERGASPRIGVKRREAGPLVRIGGG